MSALACFTNSFSSLVRALVLITLSPSSRAANATGDSVRTCFLPVCASGRVITKAISMDAANKPRNAVAAVLGVPAKITLTTTPPQAKGRQNHPS